MTRVALPAQRRHAFLRRRHGQILRSDAEDGAWKSVEGEGCTSAMGKVAIELVAHATDEDFPPEVKYRRGDQFEKVSHQGTTGHRRRQVEAKGRVCGVAGRLV